MNGMQIFEKKEFGSVRVVEHEGEPLRRRWDMSAPTMQ